MANPGMPSPEIGPRKDPLSNEGQEPVKGPFDALRTNDADVIREAGFRRREDAKEEKQKPGYMRSNKELAAQFSKKELSNLRAIKKAAEEGDFSGPEDSRDLATRLEELKEEMGERKFRRFLSQVQFLRWQAQPEQYGRFGIGPLEGGEVQEALPSADELSRHRDMGGVLDEGASTIIQAFIEGKENTQTKQQVLEALRGYGTATPIEREKMISVARLVASEDEIHDNFRSLVETYPTVVEYYDALKRFGTIQAEDVRVLGRLIENEALLFSTINGPQVRDRLVSLLGASGAFETVPYLERYAERIRQHDYRAETGERNIYPDYFRALDFNKIIGAIEHIRPSAGNDAELTDFLNDFEQKIIAQREEADANFRAWVAEHPGWALGTHSSVPSAAEQEEQQLTIREQIKEWKNAPLSRADTAWVVQQLGKAEDPRAVAEEILRELEENPSDMKLYELYGYFNKSVAGDPTERFGKILLADSFALNADNTEQWRSALERLVERGSPVALEYLSAFSQKIKDAKRDKETASAFPSEFLRWQGQQFIIGAAGQLEVKMAGGSHEASREEQDAVRARIEELREIVNDNIEEAVGEFQDWKKKHPEWKEGQRK